jgi:uncharacterized protein
MSAFRINVADILAHPGARRAVVLEAPLEDAEGAAAYLDGPVRVDLTLERIHEGIVARGTMSARWRGACSVCLRELTRTVEVHVDELFEPGPLEGETYPLEGHEVDLDQLVRDSVLLELPLAPHCDEPCEPARAPDPDDAPSDPRWAALSELEL